MSGECRLLVDAGGTNVRFGRADAAGKIDDAVSLPTTDFARFEDALQHYIDHRDNDVQFTTAAIAGAGPVGDGQITLTNNAWCIRSEDIGRILGNAPGVRLVNDLEAVAYGLPHLSEDDIDWIAPTPERSRNPQRMLAVNVGTGFGAACVIRGSRGWVACPSEAGHMTLGALDSTELDLHRKLAPDPLTVEDVLSGDGVRNLRAKLALMDGNATADDWFSIWLARASNTLALATASWDGVLFCGSVVSAWWQAADHAAFRKLFIGSGPMREPLQRTPIGLIRHDLPAFIGLMHLEI